MKTSGAKSKKASSKKAIKRITKFFIACRCGNTYSVFVYRGNKRQAKASERGFDISSNSVAIQYLSNLANSRGNHLSKVEDVSIQMTIYPTICIYMKGYWND